MFLQIFEDEKPEITLKAGETLFNEGDDADSAYVVRDGEIRLSIKGKEIASIMTSSDIVGEMALIDDDKRSATAIAGPDGATLHILDKALFKDAISEDPEFAVELMKTLVMKIRAWGKTLK